MSKTSSNKIFEKIILVAFILVFLFLFSVSNVFGQISIDNIDMPTSLEENNILTTSFTVLDEIGDVSYKIYYDGLLVSENNTYDIFVDYSTSGIHIFNFFASDNVSNFSVNQSIEIINVPMFLNIISPVSKLYTNKSIDINVSVSTYANICLYDLFSYNNLIPSKVLSGILNGNDTTFYTTIALMQDGNYSVLVTCSNSYDSVNNSISFNVDTVSPVIISKSYGLDENNSVTFNVVTNINSNCRYDLQDKSYDLMGSSFMHTNYITHSTKLTNLANGYYTYYIKCKNSNNFISNTEMLSFNIITKPYASIVLSRSSPIKAGTYEVKLRTTKAVTIAPTLSYNFNTDSNLKYVTLTGSGIDWSGYLIIAENTPDCIGTFHYSATDYEGNLGNIINSGELFIVDTTKPLAPSSININAQPDGSIKLKWYYDSEAIQKYSIYRSIEGDPNYVDYYADSSSTQYVDKDMIDGITYYYRVAAIDTAGNTGLLSEMIQAKSNKVTSSGTNSEINLGTGTNSDSSNTGQVINPAISVKINQLVSEFNNYLLDIDSAKLELNKINDPTKLKIIAILGLSENVNSAKSTINNLIIELNSLKNTNINLAELDVKLNKFRMDALKAKSFVTEDIIVNEQSSYDQITQESDVNLAISELLTINLSKDVFTNYSNINKKLQDDIVVNTEVFIFKIKYLGKDDYDKYTLIKKIVSSSQELNNISIIEMIPKSFERKASDIIFDIDNQEKPTVVKDDPVLRWDSNIFNKQTIYYMINNNAEMYSAKSTKTIVVYSPNFKVTETSQDLSSGNTKNRFTGFVTDNIDIANLSSLSIIQWIIILGVGLILGLSTYYVALDNMEKKRDYNRLKDHKIISRKLDKSYSKNNVSNSTLRNSGTAKSNIISYDELNKFNSKNILNNTYLSNTSTINTNKINNSGFFSKFSIKKLLRKKSLKISNIPLVQIPIPSSNNFNGDVSLKKVNVNSNTVAELNKFNMGLKLTQANVRINNFDYENSRLIYNLCLNNYNTNVYSKSDKEELKVMLEHLYLKLTVYRIIFLSRKHIDSRDYLLLKKDIDMINKISKRLYSALSYIDEEYKDSELKFITYVNNSKKHLESRLS